MTPAIRLSPARLALIAPLLLVALLAPACAYFTPPDTAPRDVGVDGTAVFHGCSDERFVDRRADGAMRTVTVAPGAMPFAFEPPCLRIATGQSVVFVGTFSVHPLAPGVPGHPGATLADNPIPVATNGERVEVTFPTAGVFPYACTVHGAAGMTGVVRVEAP